MDIHLEAQCRRYESAGDLENLYKSAKAIIGNHMRAICARNNYYLEDFDDRLHDEAADFIKRYYLDGNHKKVQHSFHTVLYPFAKHGLYKYRRIETEPLNEEMVGTEWPIVKKNSPIDRSTWLGELLEEEQGDLVLWILNRQSYYKRAILRIAQYKPRRWIYDRAQQLRYLWLCLHG
jgi:hypothetical protein